MKKLTPAQTADCLTQIVELATRLRTLEPVVRRRAGTTGRDGYPPTSGPGGAHGPGGDPVGNCVALRLDHPRDDILATAHVELLNNLDQARRLLEAAESAGKQSLPPTALTDDEDGCISCQRIKRWAPIHRTRRCRWCWTYTQTEGEDPPIAFLRAHHDGRRLTVRLAQTIRRR